MSEYVKKQPVFPLIVTAASGILILIIRNPLVSLLCIAAAFPLAGTGLAYYFLSASQSKQKAYLLLFLSIGFCIGGAQHLGLLLEHNTSSIHLNHRYVDEIQIIMEADSYVSAGGTTIYRGRLQQAGSRGRNIIVSAQGSVLVFAENGRAAYWGERLTVYSRHINTKDDFEIAYNVSARPDDIQSLGFVLPLSDVRKNVLTAVLHQIDYFTRDTGGLYKALFLGVKQDLDFELQEEFRKTGSMHLLALSGLHVGMIVVFVMALLFWIKQPRIKIVAVVVIAVLYLFLAGIRPSLLRAVLMTAAAAAGFLLDRERRVLNILAFSACAILVLDPAGVYSLSFALSYAALLGILTFGKKIQRMLSSRIPSKISGLLAAACGAQLFTAPFVLQSFGEIFPAGIIASVFLVPAVTVFFWTGTVFLPVSLIPLESIRSTLSVIMDALYTGIKYITHVFAFIPGIRIQWESWYWIPVGIIGMIAATNIVEVVIHELRKQKRDSRNT